MDAKLENQIFVKTSVFNTETNQLEEVETKEVVINGVLYREVKELTNG